MKKKENFTAFHNRGNRGQKEFAGVLTLTGTANGRKLVHFTINKNLKQRVIVAIQLRFAKLYYKIKGPMSYCRLATF